MKVAAATRSANISRRRDKFRSPLQESRNPGSRRKQRGIERVHGAQFYCLRKRTHAFPSVSFRSLFLRSGLLRSAFLRSQMADAFSVLLIGYPAIRGFRLSADW